MSSNLQIILAVIALVLSLFVLYLFFRTFFTRSLIQNSLDDSKSLLFDNELEQGTLGFEGEDLSLQEQKLIILNLVSMDKSNFDMNQILTLLKNLDAKYNNGFFTYRDLHGKEIFRIASGISPGILESDVKTHVLLLALDLNQASDPLKAFKIMLDVASSISEKIYASICDASRAPLSKQMIEHLKSKAQEVSHLKSLRNFSE
tara:strand:- start:3445 stop:4053 length:609 start_codon:yes stop_codon:yes gene_type:complete